MPGNIIRRTPCSVIFMVIGLVVLAVVVIGLSAALASKNANSINWVDAEESEINTASPSTSKHTELSTTKRPPEFPWQEYRLPTNVIPKHYDLTLRPVLDSGEFYGEEDIHIEVTSPTDKIIFHSAALNITHVKLSSKESQVGISDQFYYVSNEVYVVKTVGEVSAGDYVISLKFEGNLIGRPTGFYRSVYVDSRNNQTRYLATSKFEPTYARRAFPCFDEPALKATFKVHLIHHPEYTALSNMNEESSTPYADIPELLITTFNTTVPMSTYLACFTVSDFNFTSGVTESGVPFRVFSRPELVKSTEFALKAGIRIQDFYEKYFDIHYPLPKQDMVGIPDFESGAMEHWGLITYRETSLLYDPQIVSLYQKKSIANTIAHELTHQWFGNLVTMEWWDDLWLNEGFASFFSMEGIAQLDEPAWKSWRQGASFLVNTLHSALYLDSIVSSHPIIQPVTNPDEINAIFDMISYKKGSSVIRMLEAFMGEENFQKGIHVYLKKYAYKNARTEDLWNVLSKSREDINILEVMKTWTHQMGYPVITIERKGSTITATQTRFLADSNATYNASESPYGYLWEVPLTYRTSENSETKTRWMHKDEKITWEENNFSPTSWIKFNVDQTGVYRVNYDNETWEQLIKLMCSDPKALSVADLTHLMDDAFSLAEAGLVSYNIPLQLIRCLPSYHEYEMWSTAGIHLNSLARRLQDTAVYPSLRQFVLNLVDPMYRNVTWEDTGSFQEKLLRAQVLGFACYYEHEDCIKEAGIRFKSWLNDKTHIPPDIQRLVFVNGLKAELTPVKTWEKVWELYLIEPTAQMKNNLLATLTSTKTTWLLHRLLVASTNEDLVRSQDFFNLLTLISNNPSGNLYVWRFIRNRWQDLINKFTRNSRNLGNLVRTVCSSFATPVGLSEMEAFFALYPDAGAGTMTRQLALDQVRANIEWSKKYTKLVGQLLDELNTV